MDTPFLFGIESRWNALSRAPGSARIRSFATRPSGTELLIEVSTSEARATISARETSQYLRIVVQRFKDERVLCDGTCPTDLERERWLGLLCDDLSASPFA